LTQEYEAPEKVMEFVPKATRFVEFPDRWPMRRGGTLHRAKIAYETVGHLNSAKSNVILIMPGLSTDAHFASSEDDSSQGWWEEMVGPGKPIDTRHWHVICVNPLGSCKGSTGPASVNPRTGNPYRLTFPELSMEDIADSAAYAVRTMGFERLACVIGTSMGGMSSLALLARHPNLTSNHINISSAVHAQPLAIAMRSLQREVIQNDPLWNKGQYDQDSFPAQGMVTARKLGLISYRSEQEWNSRFGRKLSGSENGSNKKSFCNQFEVEKYLEYQARRFVRSFDPNCFLYLSQSIDWFDLGESFDCPAQEALLKLRIDNALVMGVHTDILFPLHQQKVISDGMRNSGSNTIFTPLNSPVGHDAFLVETKMFGQHISDFLSLISD
jgi:homoserine O-acetyltransferase/O-succinyltransferase